MTPTNPRAPLIVRLPCGWVIVDLNIDWWGLHGVESFHYAYYHVEHYAPYVLPASVDLYSIYLMEKWAKVLFVLQLTSYAGWRGPIEN
jgi:hypothetical protein